MRISKDYLNGKFLECQQPSGEWIGLSPADLSEEVGRVKYSYESVALAVDGAKTAQKAWRKLSFEARAEYLKKFQTAVREQIDLWASIISKEVGKPTWEAKGEVQSVLNKVDITLNEGFRAQSDFEIQDVLPKTVGVCRNRPHGVMAVVGPFNFPVHLPLGHILPALLAGNAVVFKPSEKTPFSGQLIAEAFDSIQLPAGVFQLVQGDRETGRKLVIHEGVAGVLFTGSYEVGMRIKQDTLLQSWKLLALEMGGKNALIANEDADLRAAVFDSVMSICATAGQRCSATSRLIVSEKIRDAFESELVNRLSKIQMGHYSENPLMGPVIDAGAVDRYLKYQSIAQKEGGRFLLKGKQLDLSKKGHYVSPTVVRFDDNSLEAVKKSSFQQNELFVPNVSVVGFKTIEEAVALANATQFGLVCSVYTKSHQSYLKFYEDLEFGLVNWNKPTVGAASKLPFGGLKRSGNHFPTALYASRYCSYPTASLECADPKVAPESQPGMNWL